MVVNPYTISLKATLADALRLMEERKISGVPVVEDGSKGKLLGILTNRDVRFATNGRTPVSELMRYAELLSQILQAAVERLGIVAKPLNAQVPGNGHGHSVAAE